MSCLDNFYGWEALLAPEREKSYFDPLRTAVEEAYASDRPVYPPREKLLEALRLTPPEQVKCVILGQDPYHEPGQAHGLSFSVPEGTPFPPSLRNIYKELAADLGTEPPAGSDLTPWAEQGVLLLNTTLTVYGGEAGSHRSFGWQHFTDAVISAAAALPQSIVFILWGADAGKKAALIGSEERHLILRSAHPSPLSAYRGFFGSRPFSRCNEFLLSRGETPIEWV